MSEQTITELGATMRAAALEYGHCTVGHKYIFARLTRHGNEWALELNDIAPVTHETADQWAAAVGAPSVEWRRTAGGKVARCEWTGSEEPAGDGPRATWNMARGKGVQA
jgi:hypothetical protein